jgi:tRNA (adenine57-N1/adenine58-N1)-methyltransferase
VEQVSELIHALELEPFEETEVCEILVRPWKVVPGRLRPNDRMAAHTAFLVFTRIQERSADWDALIPLGTRERKQEAARQARLAEARGEECDYEV